MPGGNAERDQERYAAFISYSRRGDGRAGPLLKGALEQFPGSRYGGRQRRVFVDGRDLPASPDVWADLEAALARSDHLVLIASPDAGKSSGVGREVAWWLRNRKSEKIIIVQTRGAPLAFGDDGRVVSTDVLPPVLTAALSVEPNPLYLPELPPGGRINTADPVWADALATIVATLDNRKKSDLVGDHITNLKKSKQIRVGVTAGVAVAVVLALVATFFAVRQGNEAGRQQRVAIARLLLNQADGSIVTDPRTSLRMAEAAAQLDPGPENQTGLERLVRGTHYAGTLGGHTGNVTASAFAPDGHALAAAGSDGNTILWDTRDITHPRRAGLPFTAQDESINALAWAPSNTALATADNEGTAILWEVRDLADPHPVGTIENGKLVVSLAYAGNGILLCALRDTVKIWDVRNPAVPVPLGEFGASTSSLQRMTLSADATTLATADQTGAVRLWNMTDPAHPTAIGDPLSGAAAIYGAVALSADGHLLAVASADGTTLVWTIAQHVGVRLGTPSDDRSDPINGLAFTSDGQTLTVAHQRGPIAEWNVPKGTQTARFAQPQGAEGQSFGAFAMHPAGTVFATGRSTGEVFLWTVRDRAQPVPRGAGVTQPGGSLDSMAVAGHILATVGDDTVHTWDVADIDHPRPVDALLVPDHRLHDLTLAGGRMALGSDTAEEGRVVVADLDADGRTHARGVTPPNPTHEVTAIAVRPDGQAMATGGGSGAMSLWDLADPANPRQVAASLPGYAGQLRAAVYSADGGTLVAVSDGREYRGQGIKPPGADGRGSVIAWDVADPTHPRQLGNPLTGHDGKVRAVALSPDGRTLAYGGTSERIYLWDLSDRSAPHPIGLPLTGPTANVSTLAFSPDGSTLAAGSSDHKVYLWDVGDLSRPVTPIGDPLVAADNVATVAFLPGESALVTAAADGTVAFWDLAALAGSARQASTIACAATGGGLDEAEWASRVPGLAFEPTCADGDHDPMGVPGPTDVRRFGESAAVHATVDLPAAKQLLPHSFTDATSVTDDVTVAGQTVRARIHQVIAHPWRRKASSDAIDKTTGAVYESPQIVVRDPAVDPPPTGPPPAYLANGVSKGVRYGAGGTNPNDIVLNLEFTPDAFAGGAQRTVDVYSVASRRLADPTGVATLYHYDGSWTFGADPSGAIVLRAVQPPTDHPPADDVALVPR